MSNIDLNVDVGQTKTLTFNTKDKYNSEDIVFNIAANTRQVDTLPETGVDGEQVVYQGRTYTWYNNQWNSIADDLGGREETREEQFTYQASANDESVKDGVAIVKSIKGNTVVANQLFDNNIAQKIQGSNSFYIYTDLISKFPKDHKIYVRVNYICSEEYSQSTAVLLLSYGGNFYGGSAVFNILKDNKYHQISRIITSANDNNNTIAVTYNWQTDTGLSIDKDSVKTINLTKMFGAGNEPTSVEEFERFYPNLPKEYNTGSLLNLNVDSIKSVGFNAFNGEHAKVLGGMQYYLGGNITSLTFKENLEDEGEVIEIPSDKLYTPSTNGYLVATGSDICINLSHSGYRNGEYEPYKESIVNLPIKKYFPDGMKSAGEVRDEIVWDESIGKYKAIQRVGSVDMGTLDWSVYTGNANCSPLFVVRNYVTKNYAKIITPRYISKSGVYDDFRTQDKIISTIPYVTNNNTLIRDNDYTYDDNGLESFKQSLQGQILYYELETPIETIIEDYDLIDYEVSDFGTEEIIADEPTTPIIADIQYGFNAVDEIRNHRFEINKLKKGVQDCLPLTGGTVTGNIESHGEVRGSSVSGEFVEARGTSDLAWRELRPYYLYTDTIFGIDIKLCKTSDYNIQFAFYIRGNTYTDETDKLGTLYTTIEFFRRQEDQKVLRPKQYNLSAPLRPAIIYEYDGYVYLRIFRFTSASTFQISFYTSKRSLTIGTQDFIWSEELPEGAVKLHEFDVKNQYMMSIDYNTTIKPELTGELAKPVDEVIPYLVQGVNWLRDNHLPLSGGTMSGNLNMGGKLITNGDMYETSLLWGHGHYSEKRIIDTLLTQPGNRFACTPASHIDVEYSRDNGETWLDYGLSDTQKMNIFTLDNNYVFLGKRIDDGVNGVVDVAKDRIRITWWSRRNSIVSFYGNLYKFLIKTVVQPTGQVINTKISKLSIGDYNNNTDNWITLDSVVHAGQPIERSYNYASDIHTSDGTLGSAFWENLTIALRFEFSYDSTSTEQTTTLGARLYYIKGFGNKIYQHAVGYSGVPFNNQPFTYDSYQNTTFPAKVTSQEPINYDAVIKPTQSGNTVTKTNNWVLQYLTQGVNWLRDNKVETNSDATLRTLNIKGGVNSTAMLTSTASNEFFIQLGGTIPFLLYPTVVRPGMSYTNTVDLGNTESYWKSVRAGKYIVHGGTSSQFLKADGSVDSNSYATLDSTGKVPTSQLPSYVDDVVEYTNRASFPATGEKGKIYVDVTENDIYRWTGSTYIKISGIIGAQGEKGIQGTTGLQGTTGTRGVQGIKGTDGTRGVQGFQGIKGTDGTRGLQGYQGFQGKSGVDGLQGATGLQGKNGTNGTNGVQGFQGIKGTDGTNGTNGTQGYQGIKGTDGTNGTNGVQGYRGYQGIKGTDGTSVKILGTKDSTSQLPSSGNANGDGYIIGDNLYVWDGSTWTNVGTIKGPQGVQGYQGIKGTDGSRGVQGYQGIKGTDGTNGTNGVQGYRGYQGYTGLQGATGLQGKNGTNGTNGVQGYTGLQGKQGLQGIKGTDGTNGTNGTTGAQGYQGYQGIKGTDGSRGVQGFQGIKGTDGTNGTNGATGAQGYQGYTGEVGKRGVQGYTGLQGVTGLQGIKGTNFAGCFRSQYSLHNANQSTIGIDYTFNKSGFEFFNAVISPGDTILVTYLYENNNVTYEDHFYIKIKQFSSDNTTFIGTVQNHFTINGIQGVQGATGAQGATGIQGKNGTNGSRGVQGYRGYTGLQGLQGISGALATNHWYLDKANPEVTGTNGGSILIQLDTSNDSIFAKLSTLTNGPLNGRNFIVDLADSDGSAMINNLFGDFSEYNVPNHVRYHFYIRNISKRQNPMKLNWNPAFYTNVPHRDGYAQQVVLNYGECCKIEFVKFDDNAAWVDVELEDIIYNTSTAAASENNEDNAASQIQAYCDNNKLSYTLNKDSHDIQFNLIDIIADICSKLK